MLLALLIAAQGLSLQARPDSLTLEAALELARANRGQVAVASATVEAARADRRALRALPNPIAAYSYTGDPPRQHATVDQSFDWLLRRGSEGAAGSAGIELARADSTQLLLEVERQARSAFFAALGASRRFHLAEEQAAAADSLAAIAARRRAAGDIPEFERAQAALEAARARQVVSSSREEVRVASAELERALGVPLEPLGEPAGALDRDLSDMVATRPAADALPMVVAARADSVLADAVYVVASRSRIPLPSLQAGLEWDDPTNPDAGSTILLGVAMPLPLWQSGGARADAERARADRASARLREVRSDAERRLAQTAARVEETARRALVARDSIRPLASRQRELALLAYRAGETGIVPVLDALRSEREVVRDLVSDLVAYQVARADWLALTGGRDERGSGSRGGR